MFTTATILTTIDLHCLGVDILFFAFCSDMSQLPPVMANVIILIFKDGVGHVLIITNVFFVCPFPPFLMFLKLDIALDPVLFQIQQVLFATVATVGSHCL